MTLTAVVIIGTGGHAREALDIVEAVNCIAPTYSFAGFLDERRDNEALVDLRNARIVGTVDDLGRFDASYVIGIGDGDVRARLDVELSDRGCRPATLVHPDATVGSLVDLAPGVVIAAGARLTTNVVLGRHTHVNVNATISHDCRLGDYVTVSPGASICGSVSIGDRSMLGAGCTVIPNLVVGAGVTVGAGAVVVNPLADGVTASGVPARPHP